MLCRRPCVAHHVLADGTKGSVIGALHAIRDEAAFGTVTADADSTVYVLKSADLRKVILGNPQFAEEGLHCTA